MVDSDVTDLGVLSLTQSDNTSLDMFCAGFESWRSVEWRSLCCVLQFAVARCPFVEIRVSSSGETWQARLIETVIISVAQGQAVVVFGGCTVCNTWKIYCKSYSLNMN